MFLQLSEVQRLRFVFFSSARPQVAYLNSSGQSTSERMLQFEKSRSSKPYPAVPALFGGRGVRLLHPMCLRAHAGMLSNLVQENVSLIREINDLRREINNLKHERQAQELSGSAFSKYQLQKV